MNSKEREIYDEYSCTELSYIFMVYMEFERRVNHTDEEFKDLKPGECRFDYSSWCNRLGITKKRMEKAIKNLSTKDHAIKQIEQGKRGRQSKYFLTRYEEKREENNKDNKKRRVKSAISRLEEDTGEQKKREKEKKEEHSSIYDNLSIKSNTYASEFELIWNLCPRKEGKAKARNSFMKLREEYSLEELQRAVERYKEATRGMDKKYIKHGSTFFNTGYEDFLDNNYEGGKNNTSSSDDLREKYIET